MTRFDLPEAIRNILNKAVDLSFMDVTEVYRLACKYGDDWHELLQDICVISFFQRQHKPNQYDEFCKYMETQKI